MANKPKYEYSVVIIQNDDSEIRLDKTFATKRAAVEQAETIEDHTTQSGWRIMKMFYHFDHNGKKTYDDEIVVAGKEY